MYLVSITHMIIDETFIMLTFKFKIRFLHFFIISVFISLLDSLKVNKCD